MELKKITIEDKEVIDRYLKQGNHRNCELTFTNLLLWGRAYPIYYDVCEDCLILYSEKDKSFVFPIGNGDFEKAFQEIVQECDKLGIPFHMHSITSEIYKKIEALYPGQYQIEWDRDFADYLYEREKLSDLKGKKYHKKRNHINRFLTLYPDWTYEPITDENKEECFEMAKRWSDQKLVDDIQAAEMSKEEKEEEFSKEIEMNVTRMSLNLMDYLGLRGGLLRVNGEVVAFTLGEPVNSDTFCVHIEKAFTDCQGAYPMINQQFLLHEAMDYRYVNREDDTGSEGLRKAKLSYYPILLEKGELTRKE
ncbi:MAG: DUF2156 domain-containing protein [Lachnospiraceae bacterium]